MNIAIMIPELGGGGAEKIAQRLGNHYKEQGNNVYYFVLDTHQRRVFSVKGEIINTGLASCVVDVHYGIKEVMLRLFFGSAQISKLKKRYKIDVCVSFMEECNYLNILSQRGEKVIVRVCTILSQRADMNAYLCDKRVVHFFYSLPCRIVVMSRYAVEDMVKHYRIPKKKILLIPNASDRQLQSKKEDTGLFGKYCVIAVGRLDPVKQHDRMIRAFSCVADNVPDAQLVIAGTGPNERYLKGICRKYGIADKVHFLGFQSNVMKYLSMAKVFVMSSVVEGFPNSMLEAMAAGLPVVSTDSPGGCADILGKKLKRNGYWLCRYGIMTPRMPERKVQMDEELTKEEHIFGKAVTDMLLKENMQAKYSEASKVRAAMYSEDRIYRKWDKIVGRKNA